VDANPHCGLSASRSSGTIFDAASIRARQTALGLDGLVTSVDLEPFAGAAETVTGVAVIPVSIVDRVRETGSNPSDIESLQQRYNISAFPTLVVFSPATGRMRTIKGFASPEATVSWIIEAAKAVR